MSVARHRPRWLGYLVGFTWAVAIGTVPPAEADPDSGVDALVYRPALDFEGMWSVESDRTLPALDLSWKVESSLGFSPLAMPVPGIGPDGGDDRALNYVVTLHNVVAFGIAERLTVAFDAALYRTEPGSGYGERGRYRPGQVPESTGLISLRELSNIDPSGGFEAQGLSGPLDARVAAKFRILGAPTSPLGASFLGVVRLPFGNEEMFLGDRDLVFEPRLAIGWHREDFALIANVGALFRRRTVLEAYDQPGGEMRADARAVLDIGSELSASIGAQYRVVPQLALTTEVSLLTPLPEGASLGRCERAGGQNCDSMRASDYFDGQRHGDRTAYSLLGLEVQVNDNLGLRLAGGAGFLGARSETFQVVGGLSWRPAASAGSRTGRDTDDDGVPDVVDACPAEPEDKDGFHDDDGCPEPDNDGDGVLDPGDHCPHEPEDRDGFQDRDGCPEPDNDGDSVEDVIDACPDQPEDKDGFQDDDGCPDEDNDGDGVADSADRCPNDAETLNGYEDDDGCSDERETGGPRLASDRIDLAGTRIEFTGPRSTELSATSRALLDEIAKLIQRQPVQIRVEVHVPRSTVSRSRRALARAVRRDDALSERRARVVLRYLVEHGRVPLPDLQAVGLGSDRPRSDVPPSDPAQARIDFILIRQVAPP